MERVREHPALRRDHGDREQDRHEVEVAELAVQYRRDRLQRALRHRLGDGLGEEARVRGRLLAHRDPERVGALLLVDAAALVGAEAALAHRPPHERQVERLEVDEERDELRDGQRRQEDGDDPAVLVGGVVGHVLLREEARVRRVRQQHHHEREREEGGAPVGVELQQHEVVAHHVGDGERRRDEVVADGERGAVPAGAWHRYGL